MELDLRPSEIYFTQGTINNVFRETTKHGNVQIGDTLDGLLKGQVSIGQIPKITVFKRGKKWFGINNRRLWIFKKLEEFGKCTKISVKESKRYPLEKFSTKNGGMDVELRRDAGGTYWKQQDGPDPGNSESGDRKELIVTPTCPEKCQKKTKKGKTRSSSSPLTTKSQGKSMKTKATKPKSQRDVESLCEMDAGPKTSMQSSMGNPSVNSTSGILDYYFSILLPNLDSSATALGKPDIDLTSSTVSATPDLDTSSLSETPDFDMPTTLLETPDVKTAEMPNSETSPTISATTDSNGLLTLPKKQRADRSSTQSKTANLKTYSTLSEAPYNDTTLPNTTNTRVFGACPETSHTDKSSVLSDIIDIDTVSTLLKMADTDTSTTLSESSDNMYVTSPETLNISSLCFTFNTVSVLPDITEESSTKTSENGRQSSSSHSADQKMSDFKMAELGLSLLCGPIEPLVSRSSSLPVQSYTHTEELGLGGGGGGGGKKEGKIAEEEKHDYAIFSEITSL